MIAVLIVVGCALGLCAAAYYDHWGAFWGLFLVGVIALCWWLDHAFPRR